MKNITMKQTATQIVPIDPSIPSTFGMSACGRALGASAFAGNDAVWNKGHMGLAICTYVPGTNAWSPPTS